jgi:hypothetical protein
MRAAQPAMRPRRNRRARSAAGDAASPQSSSAQREATMRLAAIVGCAQREPAMRLAAIARCAWRSAPIVRA